MKSNQHCVQILNQHCLQLLNQHCVQRPSEKWKRCLRYSPSNSMVQINNSPNYVCFMQCFLVSRHLKYLSVLTNHVRHMARDIYMWHWKVICLSSDIFGVARTSVQFNPKNWNPCNEYNHPDELVRTRLGKFWVKDNNCIIAKKIFQKEVRLPHQTTPTTPPPPTLCKC